MGTRLWEVTSLWLGDDDIDLVLAELWVIDGDPVEWGIAAILAEPRSVPMGRYDVTCETTAGSEHHGLVRVVVCDGRTLRLVGRGPLTPMPRPIAVS